MNVLDTVVNYAFDGLEIMAELLKIVVFAILMPVMTPAVLALSLFGFLYQKGSYLYKKHGPIA